MKLKPGYKKTDVGAIPEDWAIREVREFAKIITGPFGTLLKASEYSDSDGVPLVSVGEIGDGFFRIGEHTPKVPKQVVNRLPQYLLRTGDVVFGRKGAVDRSALVSENECGWFLGSDGISVRPTSDCHPPYLAAQFRSADTKAWLIRNAVGTTMASLNQGVLGRAIIPFAPLLEQSAIADALNDVDALLAAQDALIAKQRAIKQGAMQELLTGKRRLPGFGRDWEVKRLDQLAEIRSGGTPSTTRPEFWDGDVLWVTPTDITALDERKYLADTARKITALGLKASSAEIIPINSIVMTTRATIGECAITATPLSTNQGFKNFLPYKSVDVEFLYYLLTTQKQGFISLCAGSTFLEIGKAQLIGYEVRIPKKEEQTAIAQALSDMDAEINALKAKREKIARLKQGMMQELLTGRIRLVQPAALIAATPVEGKSDGSRKANVHFMRSVLAAELIDQLHNEPTFGHVKFQKLIFLTEHLCKVDTGSNYHRDAAGPYDNRALRSIDSQLRTQKWFEARKLGGRYQYVPLEKRGGHKEYFDRYYANIRPRLDEIIDTFRTAKTEQCEIVATLYGAWDDLLRHGKPAIDDAIVDQVLNHWHDDKKRIEPKRWHKALDWMREKGFAPEGSALPC